MDGILHKVFPSKEYKLRKVGSFTYSPSMLKELKKEINNGKKLIIHFYGAHQSLITWLLLKLKPVNTIVIIQQLGGWFDCFSFDKRWNILRLIPYSLEKKAFKYVNKYLTASITEQAFLTKKFKSLDFEFFLNGIDFSLYKPGNKTNAKKDLGISSEKKMILYVGRFNSTKNVNILIDAFEKINLQYKDVVLYLIGGYKEDEYYDKAVRSGATIIERTDQSINKYFAASDVYVMPINDFGVREFGGIGIAPLEALAMNTPVISENLKHCPGSLEEILKLGISNINYSVLDEQIMDVLENSLKYKDCRQIAMKYFDIHKNTHYLIGLYDNLISDQKI